MTERDFDVLFPEENLQELEAGFGISFSSKVYEDDRTLGELFDSVWKELAPHVTTGGRCPTTASFHRLKRLIERQCPGQTLTPHTCLAQLNGFSYATLLDALRNEKWRAPSRGVRPASWVSGGVVATASIWAVNLSETLALVMWCAIFVSTVWAAHKWLFRKLWYAEFRTLGNLAQCVARLNLRRLRAEGATGMNQTLALRLLTYGDGNRSDIFIWDF